MLRLPVIIVECESECMENNRKGYSYCLKALFKPYNNIGLMSSCYGKNTGTQKNASCVNLRRQFKRRV